MNSLKLPGQLIGHIRARFQERTISFKKILTLDLHRPPFQIDLDEDKIDGMIKSFRKNRDYLMFKNKVVIGVIVTKFSAFDTNYKMYIIDGQHRIEMAKKLALEDENDSLTFCYYETNSNKEMKKLFIEINKDSYKNAKYIELDDFKQNIHDELKNYLYTEKNLFFAPKKKESNKLITISEFLDKLTAKNYFEKFTLLKHIIEDLESKNKIFYKSIDYKEYLIEDPNYFYSEERSSVAEGFIVGLKNNNFLDFLCDNEVVPDHKFKKQKDVISPKLRILVWTRWYGEQPSGPCPLCKKIIKIGKNGFHCGHIKSEANGGETVLENLRPLCGTCNTKMNSMNWEDYEKI